MTNKIMELADEYAESTSDTYYTKKSAYNALATEVQAQQDYTRAVIAERDALRKTAQMALKWIEAVNEPGLGGSDVAKQLRKELGL